MTNGISVVGIYVHDQDAALDFYVNKLGFAVHTDAKNGNYRWLTVTHPEQPGFEGAEVAHQILIAHPHAPGRRAAASVPP